MEIAVVPPLLRDTCAGAGPRRVSYELQMFVCRFMIVVIFKLQGFRDERRGERGRVKTTHREGARVGVCQCVCVCAEWIYKLVNW